MTVSRLTRWMLVVYAILWIALPTRAQVGLLQVVSPIQSPLDSPIGLPTPVTDPALCGPALPCDPAAPTPAATFQAFMPGVSQPGSETPSPSQATPPDLGTVLNYVAAGVVVVGVALKVYWFISDRRKASTDKQRMDNE